jgi:hypothetical protein
VSAAFIVVFPNITLMKIHVVICSARKDVVLSHLASQVSIQTFDKMHCAFQQQYFTFLSNMAHSGLVAAASTTAASTTNAALSSG